MSKVLGITGAVTLGGVDYQIESIDYKIEVEKNPFTPIGGNGWRQQITGGERFISGSFEFPLDTTLVTPSGGLLAPLTDTLAPMVIHLDDSHSISFTAYVNELGGDKKSKGIHKIKCAFESSDIPTFS